MVSNLSHLIAKRDYFSALNILSQRIKLHSDNALHYFHRSRLYELMRMYRAALDDAEIAFDLACRFVSSGKAPIRYYYRLANCQYSNGFFIDASATILKSALCDDSDSDWNTVIKLNDLLVRVKKARKTEIRYDSIRQLNPALKIDDSSTTMTSDSSSLTISTISPKNNFKKTIHNIKLSPITDNDNNDNNRRFRLSSPSNSLSQASIDRSTSTNIGSIDSIESHLSESLQSIDSIKWKPKLSKQQAKQKNEKFVNTDKMVNFSKDRALHIRVDFPKTKKKNIEIFSGNKLILKNKDSLKSLERHVSDIGNEWLAIVKCRSLYNILGSQN